MFVIVTIAHVTALANGSDVYENADRAALESARKEQAKTFEERDLGCYAAFAVTQCLNRVQSDRLAVQAVLNRRERQLNDVQRSNQAREQRERMDRKRTEHESRIQKLVATKTDSHAEPTLNKPDVPAAAARFKPEVRSITLTTRARALNVAEYELKQRVAAEKRQAVNARMKANTKPAAATLPLPP